MAEKGRHTGWKTAEEELLFAEADRVRQMNRPLKQAFAAVAKATGRKPNSVRNYYYSRVKDDDRSTPDRSCSAFVPFTDSEARDLLKTVLTAQSQGLSVRACTLAMGGGDNRLMLRYQNKYRALLKSDPQLVRSVAAELTASGIAVPDPLGRKRNRVHIASAAAASRLSALGDFDGEAFISGLETLLAAAQGSTGLKERVEAQQEIIRRQERELLDQRERWNALYAMFSGLMKASRDYLARARQDMPAGAYMAELQGRVMDCERMLAGN